MRVNVIRGGGFIGNQVVDGIYTTAKSDKVGESI